MARLGGALIKRGHYVRRINFNGGDRLYWPLPGAIDYRGSRDAWLMFIGRMLGSERITDIVLFGDCRPLHQDAIVCARRLRVRVHVFEEGYIRPGWVTMEADGVNGYSSLPRDPDWFFDRAGRTAMPARVSAPVHAPGMQAEFRPRAARDVAYQAMSLATRPLFPGYRTHRPWHPLVECAGWVWRLSRRGRERRRSASVLKRLGERPGTPYFLFPLQLDCDYQLRTHSRYHSLSAAVEEVLRSFAAHAAPGTLLVIKQHPLENGLRNWRGYVARRSRMLGIENRVLFLEDALLESLVESASGMVTINSTSGMAALEKGVAVKVLGAPVYAIPGLVFAGTLDAFWTRPGGPSPALFAAFRAVLIDRCLLPGSFFTESGLRTLVDSAVRRLEGDIGAPVCAAPAARRPAGAPWPDLGKIAAPA